MSEEESIEKLLIVKSPICTELRDFEKCIWMTTPVQKNRKDCADADMIEVGAAGRKAIELGK